MRLIDVDEIIKEIWGVVIEDMFHMHETVEVVSAIDIEKAPTVKAIPVEWIKKYMKEELTFGSIMWLSLNDFLQDWEKENDKDSE